MFVENLLNQGNAPLLTELLKFTSSREKLLAENVVNVDTPGYRQKDLSLEKFQAALQNRLEMKNSAPPGSVGFDDIRVDVENPTNGILFHDGNNRSIEQLTTDQAKNAMMHNLAIELLRKQFQTMEMALRERVSEGSRQRAVGRNDTAPSAFRLPPTAFRLAPTASHRPPVRLSASSCATANRGSSCQTGITSSAEACQPEARAVVRTRTECTAPGSPSRLLRQP